MSKDNELKDNELEKITGGVRFDRDNLKIPSQEELLNDPNPGLTEQQTREFFNELVRDWRNKGK